MPDGHVGYVRSSSDDVQRSEERQSGIEGDITE